MWKFPKKLSLFDEIVLRFVRETDKTPVKCLCFSSKLALHLDQLGYAIVILRGLAARVRLKRPSRSRTQDL